jgi:hypothetical protein
MHVVLGQKKSGFVISSAETARPSITPAVTDKKGRKLDASFRHSGLVHTGFARK